MEKAGAAGLVTAALESGALTQTFGQNLLALRGNTEGLFRFLSWQQVLPHVPQRGPRRRHLPDFNPLYTVEA